MLSFRIEMLLHFGESFVSTHQTPQIQSCQTSLKWVIFRAVMHRKMLVPTNHDYLEQWTINIYFFYAYHFSPILSTAVLSIMIPSR